MPPPETPANLPVPVLADEINHEIHTPLVALMAPSPSLEDSDSPTFADGVPHPLPDVPSQSSSSPGATTSTGMQTAQASSPIIIQVGERRFTVQRLTLADRSPYFASLLSPHWGDKPQLNGAYFIDMDGAIFEHVLRYLRLEFFPVLYDRTNGHHYAEYHAILEQAKFFQIAPLVEWLEARHYLRAVQIQRSAMVIEGVEGFQGTTNADTSVQAFPVWETVRNYVCPRGIFVHYGDPTRCGRVCHNARGDADLQYDEQMVLKVLCVREETIWKYQGLE